MCFNGNYASYAIDPDEWDKYMIVKPKARETGEKRQVEQSDAAGIEDSMVENDDNKLRVGAKSW